MYMAKATHITWRPSLTNQPFLAFLPLEGDKEGEKEGGGGKGERGGGRRERKGGRGKRREGGKEEERRRGRRREEGEECRTEGGRTGGKAQQGNE